MSCAPFTCCSIEAATDCETTSALAPGRLVVTVTCGGTTCGYCAIGSPSAASAPTRIMSSAMTVEKTGRSMKKLSTLSSSPASSRWASPACRDGSCRCPPRQCVRRAARPLATTQSLPTRWLATICRASTLSLGADDVHRLGALQLLHRLLRNADRVRAVELGNDDPHEQARPQQALGIGQRDAHLQRAAPLVERGVDEVEPPDRRVLGAVGEPDAEARRPIAAGTSTSAAAAPVLR